MSNAQNRRIIVIDDNEAIHADFRKLLGAAGSDAVTDELVTLESQLFGGGGDARTLYVSLGLPLPVTLPTSFFRDGAPITLRSASR